MRPRIVLDLDPGLTVVRALPNLDLLDIAYGATHGGACGMIASAALFTTGSVGSVGLFDRPGLPLLTVKAEIEEIDRVAAFGQVPDRIVLVGDRGRALSDVSRAVDFVARATGAGQEVGALIEPEPTMLKECARAKMQWVYFSSVTAQAANSSEAAAAEIARIESASAAANKLRLRVAVIGPMGKQLPSAIAAISSVEELVPTPDLWEMALRCGWERAISEFATLMR